MGANKAKQIFAWGFMSRHRGAREPVVSQAASSLLGIEWRRCFYLSSTGSLAFLRFCLSLHSLVLLPSQSNPIGSVWESLNMKIIAIAIGLSVSVLAVPPFFQSLDVSSFPPIDLAQT